MSRTASIFTHKQRLPGGVGKRWTTTWRCAACSSSGTCIASVNASPRQTFPRKRRSWSISLNKIYTVGHSNHSIEKFIGLLIANGINAVADVRSRPFSRRNPQFNKERLAATLLQHGIVYVFLGKELGARSEDPSCYEDGRVQYGRLAATPVFRAGIERVLAGAQKYRLALMCAE